jgi:hypothetical protein
MSSPRWHHVTPPTNFDNEQLSNEASTRIAIRTKNRNRSASELFSLVRILQRGSPGRHLTRDKILTGEHEQYQSAYIAELCVEYDSQAPIAHAKIGAPEKLCLLMSRDGALLTL